MDRLTDSSRYGGTHKERFDASGKGRGKVNQTNIFLLVITEPFKEGRVDPKSDGYVAGYKGKREADAKMKKS